MGNNDAVGRKGMEAWRDLEDQFLWRKTRSAPVSRIQLAIGQKEGGEHVQE